MGSVVIMPQKTILTTQQARDILSDAFEGGAISYWVSDAYFVAPFRDSGTRDITELRFSTQNSSNPNYTEIPPLVKVTTHAIQKAAQDIYDNSEHRYRNTTWFKDLLKGDPDATTADGLVQIALFSKIIYG